MYEATSEILSNELLSGVVGAVVGAIATYLGAVGLAKRNERQTAEAARRQLGSLLGALEGKLCVVKKNLQPTTGGFEPELGLIFERSFVTDTAIAIQPRQLKSYYEAIVRIQWETEHIEATFTEVIKGERDPDNGGAIVRETVDMAIGSIARAKAALGI